MPAPDEIVARAYLRARGRCECEREGCAHQGRCNADLQPGRWRGFIVSELVADAVLRCQALCLDCYAQAIDRRSVVS